MGLLRKLRKVYFFGYGATREPEMIQAITGQRPMVIGPAVLDDYELRVQSVKEIPKARAHLRQLLRHAWGDSFKSYVIVPRPGSKVAGTLFKLSLHDRHLIDGWELVPLEWSQKVFVQVRLGDTGKTYRVETQQLGSGQHAAVRVRGVRYRSWLWPKRLLIRTATENRKAKAAKNAAGRGVSSD
jgi:hypothetical protein